ncbi:hypothetical protein OQA88_9093 [Cercophora sp. LCS_1]
MKPTTFLLGLAARVSAFSVNTSTPKRQDLEAITDMHLFSLSLPQFEAKHNNRDPNALDWTTDNCTLSPDNPLGFPFVPACHRHDFGYRNYRRQSRFTKVAKRRIDDNFLTDLYYQRRPVRFRRLCRALARVYHAAVIAFGGLDASDRDESLTREYEETVAVYNALVLVAQHMAGSSDRILHLCARQGNPVRSAVMKFSLVTAAAVFSAVQAQDNSVTTFYSTDYLDFTYTVEKTVLYGPSPVTPIKSSFPSISTITDIFSETGSRNINRTAWVTSTETLPLATRPSSVARITGIRTITSNATGTVTDYLSPTLATVTFTSTTCTNDAAPPKSTVTVYTGDYTPVSGQATAAPTAWPTAVTIREAITVTRRVYTFTGSTVTLTSTATVHHHVPLHHDNRDDHLRRRPLHLDPVH